MIILVFLFPVHNMPFFKPVIFTLWIQAQYRVLLQGKKMDIWDKLL